MNKLNDSSVKKLSTVKNQLQKIVNRAAEILAESKVFFIVTQGLRTAEEQKELYAQGRTKPGKIVTWTLNSNHIGGNAIDLAPLLDGKLNWDENGKLGLWPVISSAMKRAAQELNEPITWGGDWAGKKNDRPHFELVNRA